MVNEVAKSGLRVNFASSTHGKDHLSRAKINPVNSLSSEGLTGFFCTPSKKMTPPFFIVATGLPPTGFMPRTLVVSTFLAKKNAPERGVLNW